MSSYPRSHEKFAAPAGRALLAVPSALADLAVAQCGVLTRAQLARAGLTSEHVRAATTARRWQSFGRAVVVLHNAPLSARQRQWVAVLLPGKQAALAGLTAAAAAGLRGFEDDSVHVLVSADCNARFPAWVEIHNSRRFSDTDVQHVPGPPRTRPARAVVDAATWIPNPRRACAVLCAAVQQRITTAEQLSWALRDAGAIRHVAIMRDVLGDVSKGAHTLTELELGPLASRAGLAPPRRQVLRREPSGRTRYVDAEFDLPDGTVLAVEIDGAVHLRPDTLSDDMSRQNELAIGGRVVLRFSTITMRLNQQAVIDQLIRVRLAHALP